MKVRPALKSRWECVQSQSETSPKVGNGKEEKREPFDHERPNKSVERKGLTSADHSNKAILLLTIPHPQFKSSAKDSPPHIS